MSSELQLTVIIHPILDFCEALFTFGTPQAKLENSVRSRFPDYNHFLGVANGAVDILSVK